MLDDLDDKQELEKIIGEMPSFPTKDAARESLEKGELKEGQVFRLEDQETAWRAGVFASGKILSVTYEYGVYAEKRLETLKRRGVAHLLHYAQTKRVPTATMPFIPQRFEDLDTGKVLFTGKANEKEQDARYENEQIDPEFQGDEIPLTDAAVSEGDQGKGRTSDSDATDAGASDSPGDAVSDSSTL